MTEKQFTYHELQEEIKNTGKLLIILFGAVYDITQFIEVHPGGADCAFISHWKIMHIKIYRNWTFRKQ